MNVSLKRKKGKEQVYGLGLAATNCLCNSSSADPLMYLRVVSRRLCASCLV